MYTYDDNTFSDLHKEVYGFRPRTDGWADWTSRTPRQKQELWNALCDELENVMKEEKLGVNIRVFINCLCWNYPILP